MSTDQSDDKFEVEHSASLLFRLIDFNRTGKISNDRFGLYIPFASMHLLNKV